MNLALKEQVQRLMVPSNALLFRAEGPRAAVVGPDSKLQLRPVAIGRDFFLETPLKSLAAFAVGLMW